MSKTHTHPRLASRIRAVRRTLALGSLGAFLAVVGGPSCAEIESTTPTAGNGSLAPRPRTNAPNPSSDDYFDQILSIDSPHDRPAMTGDVASALGYEDASLARTPGQLQLVSVTNVVKPGSVPQTTSNPAVSQNWQQLVQTVTVVEPAGATPAHDDAHPQPPAVVASVNPTFTKPSKPATETTPASNPNLANSKPVDTTPVAATIPQPEEQSAPPIASAPSETTPHTSTASTTPATTEPTEVASKPEPVEPTETTPRIDTEPTSVAAVKPDAPTAEPRPEPIPAAASVSPTTSAAATTPAPAAPVIPQNTIHIPQMSTGFGLFTLMMRIAALAAFLATGTLAFFFSKTTDRAGVTARSFNLRTRFILAFGGLATISIVACAFASVYVTTTAAAMALAACAAGSLAAAVVVCLWLERATLQPMERINRTVRALATGDLLQKPINSSVRDEFGDLARGVDRLTASMRDALTEIAISSNEITGAATQIAAGVQQMTSSATDVARQCAEASRTAAEVSRDATDGHGAIQQTAEGISALGQIASSHAAGIKSIQSHSQQVADLIKLIDDLAERTNVVALNASVEASRSGPASRTFAMLADEARRLSEQAQSAAAEAAQTVQCLNAETHAACEKVSGSESQLRQGAAVASKARADYETISSRTFTVAGAVQKAGLAAESFGASAAQSEAAATQLANRSSHMLSVMKRFKLDTTKLVPVNNRSSGVVVEQVPTAV